MALRGFARRIGRAVAPRRAFHAKAQAELLELSLTLDKGQTPPSRNPVGMTEGLPVNVRVSECGGQPRKPVRDHDHGGDPGRLAWMLLPARPSIHIGCIRNQAGIQGHASPLLLPPPYRRGGVPCRRYPQGVANNLPRDD
eukprot:1378485-Amorphochlora_amoeboformis.AAC.3